MTLAITVLVAVAFTLVWYLRRDNDLCLGLPCLMFWGASLMWLVDAVAEYLRRAWLSSSRLASNFPTTRSWVFAWLLLDWSSGL